MKSRMECFLAVLLSVCMAFGGVAGAFPGTVYAGSLTSGSSAPAAVSGPRREPAAETVLGLKDYLTDSSTVQFKYQDPRTTSEYTVNYSLQSGNINPDGDTTIRDKDGSELNLYYLKSMKVMLSASFENDFNITTGQTYTYNLPKADGTSWTGSDWQDLTGSDGTVYGTYRVTPEGQLQVRFSAAFINLDNRFASVIIDAAFNSSRFNNDKEIKYEFPGIGTFTGSLKVPKDLVIQKRDATVGVDSDSDIADIFNQHVREGGSSFAWNNYPYIELAADGQYITQILKVKAVGNHDNLTIEDYYAGVVTESDTTRPVYENNWPYDSTLKLVKVAADGTASDLTEGTGYTVTNSVSARASLVQWKLSQPVQDGDTIYIAYRTKYNGKIAGTKVSVLETEDGRARIDSTAIETREGDIARTKSDNISVWKYDSISNYLESLSISKQCTGLDTANKTAKWVIYYNLGMSYNLLDGEVIRDAGAGGQKWDPSTVNVTLLPTTGQAQYLSTTQFRSKGIQLVKDGQAAESSSYGDWSSFASSGFMDSAGYTIPAGTGYGALRIEFTTSYDTLKTNDRGDQAYLENKAYFKGCSYTGRVQVANPASYPKTFAKSGELQGKTGLIKWTSRFSLDPGMKLEFRDEMDYHHMLALDNASYPVHITWNSGASGSADVEIEKYQEGRSADENATYYILTPCHGTDTKFVRSRYTWNNPAFVIRFVNSLGQEKELSAGNYELTYYTYYSPLGCQSGLFSDRDDVGFNGYVRYYSNRAWLVYNGGQNRMNANAYIPSSRWSFKKGSDNTASPHTGDYSEIPEELQPKKADELFWWMQIDPLTETTSKVVLTDTMNLGNSVYKDVNDKNKEHPYRDSMTLEKDRFAVYNGDTKLDSSFYVIEDTASGFTLTVEKADGGYDPTKNLRVYYMTRIPLESMQQGETYRYGNKFSIAAYGPLEKDENLNDAQFPSYSATFLSNGDYQDFTYQLLSKGDDYDPSTQYITYTVKVNPYEMILNDGKTVEITDTMDSNLEYDVDDAGEFIVPLQVLDKDGNALPASDYQVDLERNADSGGYGPLKLTLPDARKLTVRYRVRVKPGLQSLTDVPATNSVRFTTGNYANAADSDTVTLTNLSGTAGGDPVYFTVVKQDAENVEKLLDGAAFAVTLYQRTSNTGDEKAALTPQDRDTYSGTGMTENGSFTIKTSYGHVVVVQETKAPADYHLDDGTPHYYIIERESDGTKEDWKARYAGTDTVLGHLTEEEWETKVTLLTSSRVRAVFMDTYNKRTVSGTKTWDDNDDQDGKRPSSITLRLLADGEEKEKKTVSADTDGNWTYSFPDLPVFGADSRNKVDHKIVYTVTEDALNDYSTSFTKTDSGYDIKNTHTPGRTSLTVTKTWDDAEDQDGCRPGFVRVQLLADGKKAADSTDTAAATSSNAAVIGGKVVTGDAVVTLSPENNWTYTWDSLPEKNAGRNIHYSVEEISLLPEGYAKRITGNAAEGYTIINSCRPRTTEITAKKKWVFPDGYDEAGGLPDIYFRLYRVASATPSDASPANSGSVKIEPAAYLDGEEVPVERVGDPDEKGESVVSFGFLPKEDPRGFTYTYFVKEVDADGRNYVPAGYVKEETGLTVTNYETPGSITLAAQKYLDDALPADGAFSFELYEIGSGGRKTLLQRNVKNDGTGAVVFDPIQYRPGDIGKTFTYLIREKAGGGRIRYDGTVYRVLVTVSADGQAATASGAAYSTLSNAPRATEDGATESNSDEDFLKVSPDDAAPSESDSASGSRAKRSRASRLRTERGSSSTAVSSGANADPDGYYDEEHHLLDGQIFNDLINRFLTDILGVDIDRGRNLATGANVAFRGIKAEAVYQDKTGAEVEEAVFRNYTEPDNDHPEKPDVPPAPPRPGRDDAGGGTSGGSGSGSGGSGSGSGSSGSTPQSGASTAESTVPEEVPAEYPEQTGTGLSDRVGTGALPKTGEHSEARTVLAVLLAAALAGIAAALMRMRKRNR